MMKVININLNRGCQGYGSLCDPKNGEYYRNFIEYKEPDELGGSQPVTIFLSGTGSPDLWDETGCENARVKFPCVTRLPPMVKVLVIEKKISIFIRILVMGALTKPDKAKSGHYTNYIFKPSSEEK